MENKYLEKLAHWGAYLVGGGKRLSSVASRVGKITERSAANTIAKVEKGVAPSMNNASGMDNHVKRVSRVSKILNTARKDSNKAQDIKKKIGLSVATGAAGGALGVGAGHLIRGGNPK